MEGGFKFWKERRWERERAVDLMEDSRFRVWEGRRRRSFWERKVWAREVAEATTETRVSISSWEIEGFFGFGLRLVFLGVVFSGLGSSFSASVLIREVEESAPLQFGNADMIGHWLYIIVWTRTTS